MVIYNPNRYDCFFCFQRLRRYLAGPFAPDLVKSPKLFAITHDAKLIITVGHWDNSIRVFSSKGKLLTRILAHTGEYFFVLNGIT